MILIVLGFLIITNVVSLIILQYERKYSKFLSQVIESTTEGYKKSVTWYDEIVDELSKEIMRLRGE